MRILHVLDHSIPLHSGYAFRTLSILREQRRRGWQTFHLTTPKQVGCTQDEEDVDGWHFFRTPADRAALQIPVIRELALMRRVEQRLDQVARNVRPDVIHAHSPVLNAIPALRVAKRLRVPVVYEVRAFWEDAAVDQRTAREGDLRYRLTRALETYAMKRADHVTTICEGLRSDILARGLPDEGVTVIPNSVDVESFGAHGAPDESLRQRLGLPTRNVVGFIGSFYAYEGLDLLLDALPLIRARHRDACLLLVGGGPEEGALRARVRELGLADHVVFTGRVPHQEVGRYYDLVDVLAYPRRSLRITELVTPLKPLEAMAQGRVLVASDVGGHRELIEHGRTGVLFHAGDRVALANAVGDLLSTPDAFPRFREAARRFVEDERSWKRSVARYEGVYARIASRAEGYRAA